MKQNGGKHRLPCACNLTHNLACKEGKAPIQLIAFLRVTPSIQRNTVFTHVS
jgi:hypothetical protein